MPADPTGAGAVPGGPDAVRRAARQILSRPEFRPTPESPLTRLRNWIGRQLAHLLDAVLGGGRFGVLGAILAVAILIALVVVIVLAVRSTTANPVRAGFSLPGPARPPADWLAEAAACERAGDWRGALRCRYRALVAELAGRGLVEEIPGRTTGEYRRLVSDAVPRASGPFAGATDLFEETWYGDRPADAASADRFRGLAGHVLEATR